jgi:hypothetical protein
MADALAVAATLDVTAAAEQGRTPPIQVRRRTWGYLFDLRFA